MRDAASVYAPLRCALRASDSMRSVMLAMSEVFIDIYDIASYADDSAPPSRICRAILFFITCRLLLMFTLISGAHMPSFRFSAMSPFASLFSRHAAICYATLPLSLHDTLFAFFSYIRAPQYHVERAIPRRLPLLFSFSCAAFAYAALSLYPLSPCRQIFFFFFR